MDADEDKALGIEAGEAAKATTQAIADEQGASREKALKVIGKAMDAGLKRNKPDLGIALKGADLALKIHDAYPSEKINHTHEMGENAMSVAVRVLQGMRKDDANG